MTSKRQSVLDEGKIEIRGARVNNLKNLSFDIPRSKLVVVTGISGSGKSSLIFDTLYAEGHRRFSESLSSYARQFLGRMSKPDVDSIDGIPPAIAIEQKVTTRNPRSTLATTTEIYDYLRLVFARIGHTFSPISGKEVRKDSVESVMVFLTTLQADFYILASLNWNQRSDQTELLLSLKENGYNRLYAEGEVMRIDDILTLDGAYPKDVWLLIDRIRYSKEFDSDTRSRLLSSLANAFSMGNGDIAIATVDGNLKNFCNRFEADGILFLEPNEYLFSFNSPLGACTKCGGLGKIIDISEDLVIPDKSKSIYEGAIACWRGEKMGWFKEHLISVAERYKIPIFEPYCKLSTSVKNLIWEGHEEKTEEESLIGIKQFFAWVETQRYKIQYKYMLSRFSGRTQCRDCAGSRLRKEALWVKVDDKNIHEVLSMNVDEALEYFNNLHISSMEREIVAEALEEINSRLKCLKDVGLSYLTLDRACNTLSGGESQRVNLVTAIGSNLVGSMYILDEPSVGLHPRDTEKLVSVLKRLRDIGNTVIVVEHDEEIMKSSDLLLDMGPKAGEAGGEVVFMGQLDEDNAENNEDSITRQYLTGVRKRYKRDKRSWEHSIVVRGAMQHNLKGMDVSFPLGVMTVVTGVSGSGKSSLVGDILYPALSRHIHSSGDSPGTFRALEGNLELITRVEYVDQNPIGRSSRSNALTYMKAYDELRKLFAAQHYAKINGYTANYFSFNSDGGRCPECQGEGRVKIEMQFMADVEMVCEQCGGKRFIPEILEVRHRGKNIDDILNMSVDEAIEFFSVSSASKEEELIAAKLKPLSDVGLGYIKLGQSSSTLSGGESQRVKLASFLSMSRNSKKQEKIMFIFDEPTTGLHLYDVEKLLKAFDALLSDGHTLVVVEHNPDVIRAADWVIDLGPGAGVEGGNVVFEGRPEDLKKSNTYTAKYI